jgi:tRNA dimethylallyltransferase
MDRELLYERADRRLGLMIESGLVEEVHELLEEGYDWSLPAMSAVGYAEFKPYFEGEATLDEVVAEIQSGLRRFIRHQYNWFSLDDPDIRWFDVTNTVHEEIESIVSGWLTQHLSGSEAE